MWFTVGVNACVVRESASRTTSPLPLGHVTCVPMGYNANTVASNDVASTPNTSTVSALPPVPIVAIAPLTSPAVDPTNIVLKPTPAIADVSVVEATTGTGPVSACNRNPCTYFAASVPAL